MGHLHRRHLARIAIAASGIALMLGGSALAQTVQMFDDAPSVEQLRSIMVPESQPGLSRSIVIQRPDTGAAAANVQRVATQPMPAARAPAATRDTPASPVEQVAASASESPRSPAAKPSAGGKPTAAGFRINFTFNSAVLPDSAHEMIDVVAQVMKGSPEIKVRVEGHTDAVGAADYNVTLSERRALSVGEYLVKQGIEPSRLILIGKGFAEPLTSNRYDPANRRVQFVRVG
jgi:outer membrane protein OmpA-like peptidoglycan-associated protein